MGKLRSCKLFVLHFPFNSRIVRVARYLRSTADTRVRRLFLENQCASCAGWTANGLCIMFHVVRAAEACLL